MKTMDEVLSEAQRLQDELDNENCDGKSKIGVRPCVDLNNIDGFNDLSADDQLKVIQLLK